DYRNGATGRYRSETWAGEHLLECKRSEQLPDCRKPAQVGILKVCYLAKLHPLVPGGKCCH
ncbi:MAG: hypothetical protein EBV10_04195, partial [Synechococcaceae bacterium WB6_1A_059]|nr:hypothetical protein [Synechococcaceae bacterium WB6_1A_059]